MNFNSVFDLSFVDALIYVLIVTHITIISVTIYLHRYSAHRALDLSPIVAHFFRFWLWLTTGMTTQYWTAIHRKHHAKCETKEDPHSPQILGLKKVLLEGAELYKKEALNEETINRYGQGTPQDWVEKNIYKHSVLGVSLLLVINFILFGFIGITIWAIQMLWIPFWAAGVINGVAHFYGYKNFTVKDASTNIFPIGILIGGEELHNNHHAFGTSAKLSNKWFEFDIGWFYIRVLEILHLAKVKKIAPRPRISKVPMDVSDSTLVALITNRFDLLTKYGKALKLTFKNDILKKSDRFKIYSSKDVKETINYLSSDVVIDLTSIPEYFRVLISKDQNLLKMVQMKSRLISIWQETSLTKEELVIRLREWCNEAESSGIHMLSELSFRLRSYIL